MRIIARQLLSSPVYFPGLAAAIASERVLDISLAVHAILRNVSYCHIPQTEVRWNYLLCPCITFDHILQGVTQDR